MPSATKQGEDNEAQATLHIDSGNEQAGEADSTMSQPLRVLVLNRNGLPIANAKVFWIVTDSDQVNPALSLTDSAGIAETRWTPHTAGADQIVRARIGSREIAFHANVLGHVVLTSPSALRVVSIVTPDGSGQVVHPDVVEVSLPGFANNRMLAVTPYPSGDASFENPSTFFGGLNAAVWRLPDGAINPVAFPLEGHLSDPDLVEDPDEGVVRLYYRGAGSSNTLWLKTTRDGIHWSQSQLLLTEPNHTLVSPAIVRRSDTRWEMWSVNAGERGCGAYTTYVERRESTDGMHWGAPELVKMGEDGQELWHLDVQYLPTLHMYVAVYSVKSHTDCTTPAIYVSTSVDGVTWITRSQPLIARGVIPEFSHIVYRSTFLYDPERDAFTFWHSGASYADSKWTWRMATERRTRSDVFNSPAAFSMERTAPYTKAPPLRIAP